MILQEEKRLLIEKIERLEVTLREEKMQDMRAVSEQYETQIRHLQEQLSHKDDSLAQFQRQFQQLDTQILNVTTVAGKYEDSQKQVQAQAKQIADLNSSIKYLEGLLDSAQE